MNIPVTKPLFGEEELALLRKPLASGWVVQGPYVQEFEQRVAAFCGRAHAVATTSCTSALHTALTALGLQPGEEVIVPAFTWITTANVVEYCGAKPVFCDIDLRTFNLDVGRLPDLVTDRTVGIIPVHLFGLPADMQPVQKFAAARGLWVVEDAACALGAFYENQHVGTFGAAGCFSFHPRKCITTGEGGMIVTNDPALAGTCRTLRNHGASVSDLARHRSEDAFRMAAFNLLGFNYRMTDLQGALGVAQMGRLQQVLDSRARLARRYFALLHACDWLVLPHLPENRAHAFQSFVCRIAAGDMAPAKIEAWQRRRDRLLRLLAEAGIGTRPGTHAPPLQAYYAEKYGYGPQDFPAAFQAERLSITLPLYPQMTATEQEYVVQTLKNSWQQVVKKKAA